MRYTEALFFEEPEEEEFEEEEEEFEEEEEGEAEFEEEEEREERSDFANVDELEDEISADLLDAEAAVYDLHKFMDQLLRFSHEGFDVLEIAKQINKTSKELRSLAKELRRLELLKREAEMKAS